MVDRLGEDNLAIAAGAVAGAIAFVSIFGVRVIDPGFLDWLLWGDRAMHVVGWLFFRNEGWSLPIGAIPGELTPIGGTIALNDSVPLLAIVFKLFAPFLPEPFQYFGLWLASCYLALGATTAGVFGFYTRRFHIRVLGAVLVVSNPVLASRTEHLALCAQFVIVAAIGIVLAANAGRIWWRRSLALNLFAAAVQPYLLAMSLALTLAAAATLLLKKSRSEGDQSQRTSIRLAGWRNAALMFCPPLAGSIALLGLLGLLGATPSGIYGYGVFSADLLALVNPAGWSAFLPSLPAGPGQYEGRAYLGTAVAVLLTIGFVEARRHNLRPIVPKPLVWCALLLWIFALSTRVTLLGSEMLNVQWLNPAIDPFTSTLRTTGRFVWPAYYLLLLTAIGYSARADFRYGTALLTIVCLVQVAEFRQVYAAATTTVSFADRYDLRNPAWSTAGRDYRHLALIPAEIHPWACEAEDTEAYEVSRFTFLAALNRLSINSGYLTRLDPAAARAACIASLDPLRTGAIDATTIYILRRGRLAELERAAGSSVDCGYLDGFAVCVASNRAAALRSALSHER